MANLLEIAQLVWEQIYPKPGNETTVTREQVVATAKTEYAYQLWIKIKQDKAEYGETDIPSFLLSENEMPIENNEMDISELDIMRGLDLEMWLQDINDGIPCKCKYIKTTLNKSKALCDDDALPDDAKIYYPVGNKIKFPLGANGAKKLNIIYANNGDEVDEEIEIDDVVGAMVRRSLLEIYLGKIGPEDKKNDSNSNSG